MRFHLVISAVLSVTSAVQPELKCNHDNCLRAFIRSSVDALSFCSGYTTLPPGASPTLPAYATQCSGSEARVSSACSCIATESLTSITTSSTSVPVSTSSSTSSITPSTTDSSTSTSVSVTESTSSSTIGTTPCTCTAYSQIAPAVAACTAITLQDISAPTNSSIDLSKLKANSVVTFSGLTTFAFTNSSKFNPMTFGGKNVTITSAPGAIIDGNGSAYWDGIGSNGGVPKPDHFIVVSKMTAGSVVQNLHIRNWPTHLFSISSCSNLTMRGMFLDNRDGNAPNARSGNLPAAHNSDGFGVSSCNDTVIQDSIVYNQDDCVAVTSGNNIMVQNMYCDGGHGLSIGSVGGKSNNNVTNVLFSNSQILNSENGARIKSNFNTTGFISNITYSNIVVSNISIYGIDVQQDYLNGGPTGSPSNGVMISNLLFENITGTATGTDYYVLCGSGSCSNIVFEDVSITGGKKSSSCNYPPSGCPA